MWNSCLKMNGKEERLPYVRMTVMTRPWETPRVNPCPQVSPPRAPWFLVFRRTFICSLSNDLEIPQLLRFAVVSFPPLPISPSLLIDVILLSIQISHHFPHPRTEQNSKSSQVPHPIQLLPFPLLQCVARHRKTATTVFSLLIVSRSHYIQVSSPPRNL